MPKMKFHVAAPGTLAEFRGEDGNGRVVPVMGWESETEISSDGDAIRVVAMGLVACTGCSELVFARSEEAEDEYGTFVRYTTESAHAAMRAKMEAEREDLAEPPLRVTVLDDGAKR